MLMTKSFSLESLILHLQKFRTFLAILFVAVAPFHAFLITLLRDRVENEAFVRAISVWRELLLAVVFITIFIEILMQREKKNFDGIDASALILTVIGFILLPFQNTSTAQWILGMRFSILPLLVFVLLRKVPWLDTAKIYRVAIGSALVVLLIGILHALFLPPDFFEYFGYTAHQGQFQPETGLLACQKIEQTGICRAASTFGGPSRYGSFLLVAAGLFLALLGHAKTRTAGAMLLGVTAISIVLTYSRSIWIGAFFALVVGIAFSWKNFQIHTRRIFLLTAIFFLLVCAFIATLTFFSPKESVLRTVFIRNASSSEHLQYSKEGLRLMRANPFGLGPGTVGPATFHFGKRLTENWYLQIGVEFGILGLALFLTFLWLLFEMILKRKTDPVIFGLGLALFGLSIAGLFSHSFEETTAAVMLFGGLAVREATPHSQKLS